MIIFSAGWGKKEFHQAGFSQTNLHFFWPDLLRQCLRTMCFTFIYNNLYYCTEIYGNTIASHLQPLQKGKKKALRALLFRNQFVPINKMHKEFQIIKVNNFIEYKLPNLIKSLLKDTLISEINAMP